MTEMVKRADFLENEVVDLTEEIKLVSPTDTPLTTLLMGRGQVVPANDITVTWREKELNSDRGTLKLEGAEAGDVITSSRKTLSNVCQIIEKVTQVSGTARSLNPNNVRFLGDNGSMQNVLGIGVQKIVTDFGEISLVLDRYADTKTILTVDFLYMGVLAAEALERLI